MYKKYLLIGVLVITLIFLFYLLYNTKKDIIQVSASKPITIKNIDPFSERKWNFGQKELVYLKKQSKMFQITNEAIFIKLPGLYHLTLNIAASSRIHNHIGEAEHVIENEDLYVDSRVEWSISDLITFPVFSQHRTDGPENLTHFSQYIHVTKAPYIFKISFKNIDDRPIDDYIIENFILGIEKKD